MNGAKKKKKKKKFDLNLPQLFLLPRFFHWIFHWISIGIPLILAGSQIFNFFITRKWRKIFENDGKWREMAVDCLILLSTDELGDKQWTANSWQLESREQEESGLWIGDCEDSAQWGGVRSDEFPAESLAESLACWVLSEG